MRPLKSVRPSRIFKPWKTLKYTGTILLLLTVLLFTGVQNTYAADDEYTYTVRLYAGNLGTLTENGIDISSDTASVSKVKDCIEVTGLKYGDTVYLKPQDAATVTDERYYIKGVRRSGRDNSEAEAPTFRVASDRDYVVAYAVSGNLVAYTVNYLDMDGNSILQSDTYYGNVGERQYVSSRYVEGYQPQALNMVKTLSANEAENVFDFQYASAAAGQEATENPSEEPDTDLGETEAGDNETQADGEDAADAADGEDTGADAATGTDDAIGGDIELPDGDVPLDQQELVDLDGDEKVPLDDMRQEQSGFRMGNLPIYGGIGAAALLALGIAMLYLRRKRKQLFVQINGESGGKTKNSSRRHGKES